MIKGIDENLGIRGEHEDEVLEEHAGELGEITEILFR